MIETTIDAEPSRTSVESTAALRSPRLSPSGRRIAAGRRWRRQQPAVGSIDAVRTTVGPVLSLNRLKQLC